MRVQANHNGRTFQPITLQVTIESRAELLNLIALTGWNHTVAEFVEQQCQDREDLPVDVDLLFDQLLSLWDELRQFKHEGQ